MKLKMREGNLEYEIKAVRKSKQEMDLKDPHTGKIFTIYNIKQLLKAARYKVVR